MFGEEQLPGQLDLCCLAAKVAQEAASLFDQERLGQRPRLGLQDLDPLLQLLDQILQQWVPFSDFCSAMVVTNYMQDLQLVGPRRSEVKVGSKLGLHLLEDGVLRGPGGASHQALAAGAGRGAPARVGVVVDADPWNYIIL